MDKAQHLLTKLAEEAAEVAQIALKTAQFSFTESMPGQPFTNTERCHQELDDLLAIVEMLNERYGFGYVPNAAAIKAKKAKVDRFLDYSIQLGTVTT